MSRWVVRVPSPLPLFALLLVSLATSAAASAEVPDHPDPGAARPAGADAPDAPAPVPDSLRRAIADTVRIARTLPPMLVRSSRLEVMSSEARRRVSSEALRSLPLDRLTDALALEPGVVMDDDIVHVRGARPGELRVEMDGIGLNEPFRGGAPELPLLGLEDLELVRGGREAEHGGGLAGTLTARPLAVSERWRTRVLWETDGGRGTRDDRVGARTAGPLGGTGLGLAIGGEAHLDDAFQPALRTPQRTRVLGASFGWRARNQLGVVARVAPVRAPERVAVAAIVTRRLLRPFNPMYSLVGWTSPCPDPDCYLGPAYSPTEIDSARYAPYNAADHYPVTDVHRTAVIVSSRTVRDRDQLHVALGWNSEQRLTSIDGNDDTGYLDPSHAPVYGLEGDPSSDPFHAYAGDVPYYRRTRADWFEARAEWRHGWPSGSGLVGGLAATHERLSLREMDFALVPAIYDSIRIFTASAPGGSGWISGRWVNEGMIANAGLRADWFSPGPDADRTLHDAKPRDAVLLSPCFAFSFPLSPRDVFQASYERIQQAPGREYLYDSRTRRISPRHPLGNPQLAPATALSYEVRLRHLSGERWTTEAGFFWRDLSGEVGARLVTLPTGPQALRYESADVAHALGLELSVARDDPGRSHLAATYTWMQAQGSESLEDGIPFYPLRLPQPPPIAEHPLAWDQPHRLTLQAFGVARGVTCAWTTIIASGLPWTPAETRSATADLSLTYSRRLSMFTLSNFSLKGRLPRRVWPAGWGAPSLGLDVRNVFDFRGQRRVSIDGYPNKVINTEYDDYAAHRTETSTGGAAFWDGAYGWVAVDDPRLDFAPRLVRLTLDWEW